MFSGKLQIGKKPARWTKHMTPEDRERLAEIDKLVGDHMAKVKELIRERQKIRRNCAARMRRAGGKKS